MKFSKNGMILWLLSILFAVVSTFLIFNLHVIMEYILGSSAIDFTQPHVLRFICYFIFTFLVRFRSVSTSNRFWILFLPVLAIDATTMIAGRELIPLRFPFATIYPCLGILCGLFLFNKKVRFWWTFAGAVLFMVLSHLYFIPAILWYMHGQHFVSKSDNEKLIDGVYAGVDGKPVRLFDTLRSKPAILEFYFVGCLPCEQKFIHLKTLYDEFAGRGLNILFICDGSASSYKQFLKHWEKNNYKNMIFLYDSTKALQHYAVEGYPTELLTSGNTIIKREKGFGTTIADKWLVKERQLINEILNNAE